MKTVWLLPLPNKTNSDLTISWIDHLQGFERCDVRECRKESQSLAVYRRYQVWHWLWTVWRTFRETSLGLLIIECIKVLDSQLVMTKHITIEAQDTCPIGKWWLTYVLHGFKINCELHASKYWIFTPCGMRSCGLSLSDSEGQLCTVTLFPFQRRARRISTCPLAF